MKRTKKRNMLLVIDGENISSKKYSRIMKTVKKVGELEDSRVYGLQRDARTKGWSDEAKKDNILKDIRLYGGPSKNKVDNKIKRDIRRSVINNKNIDIVVIVTSDGDYSDIVENTREKHKKVVVIGEKKAPKKLRDSCNMFVEI